MNLLKEKNHTAQFSETSLCIRIAEMLQQYWQSIYIKHFLSCKKRRMNDNISNWQQDLLLIFIPEMLIKIFTNAVQVFFQTGMTSTWIPISVLE